MAREKLKDFLSQKGSTDTSLTFIPDGSKDDGLGVDVGTGEPLLDLNDDIKGLLGDYVRFIMEDAGNENLPKSGNEKASSSNKGDNLVLADLQGFEKVFIEQGTVLKNKMNEYSNSGKFDDLDTLIDKVGGNFSNTEKLKEIQGRELSKHGNTLSNPSGEDNEIIKSSQRMFLKNNRFANVGSETSTSFTVKPQNPNMFESSDKKDNSGTIALQKEFGSYNKNDHITDINSLKSIGASLLLKASGFASGDTPGESQEVSEISESINDLTAGNFNIASGFTKLRFSSMAAKNAKGFPSIESGESVRDGRGKLIETDPSANNSSSYGSTYNSEFKYHNSNIKLHKMQAAIAMIAVKNVGKKFYETLINSLREVDKIDIISSGENYVAENPSGDLLGYMYSYSKSLKSLKIDNNVFKQLIADTTHPYGSAVDRGLEVVFGVSSDSNDINKVANNDIISQSPGFWVAVARSVLKSLDNVYASYESLSDIGNLSHDELFLIYKDIIESNKFIKFFNVMAVIGDISLSSNNGVKTSESVNRIRDVDSIPDNTAIPGKSRKKNGRYREELSWNQDASPSMYLLPANIIRAASRLNNTVVGESPVRGMFGSQLVKNTYTGLDVDGSYNRIPNEVVKIVEDQLEAEYVPFYIQDLRTNEIISFNAFLSALTDSITPSYTGVSGYGRMDSVQIYQGTTRSLQVGFTLYATNKEDFDAMWFKINKITTMLYPQWTPGTMVSNNANNGSKFYQPFSQVIGASPIVRLRIGDVIKSNYSRFGLARLFGIGDTNVNAIADGSLTGGAAKKVYDIATEIILKLWLTAFGSPQSTASAAFGMLGESSNTYAKIAKNTAKKVSFEKLAGITVNGFANPLAVNDIINQLKDPNLDSTDPKLGYQVSDSGLRQVYVKPNVNRGYYCAENGKKYFLTRKIKARIVKKGKLSELSDSIGVLKSDMIAYKVLCVDVNTPKSLFESSNHLIVKHSDIYGDPGQLFNASIAGLSLLASDPILAGVDALAAAKNLTNKAINLGIPASLIGSARDLFLRQEGYFMLPEVNPFVRAFESTKGRGLAGVIKSITFDWLNADFGWETEFNSRAPMGCKISFGFDVIHDLPPGLDHSGFNRAPLYNVGGIMRNVSGDVYTDNGIVAENNFKKEGKKVVRSTGTS